MKIPSIQKKLKKSGVFDLAKILHRHFPNVSTQRINDLILQLDSADQAIDVLFENKNDSSTSINDLVYLILKYRDDRK